MQQLDLVLHHALLTLQLHDLHQQLHALLLFHLEVDLLVTDVIFVLLAYGEVRLQFV